jgi:hypothetical protein
LNNKDVCEYLGVKSDDDEAPNYDIGQWYMFLMHDDYNYTWKHFCTQDEYFVTHNPELISSLRTEGFTYYYRRARIDGDWVTVFDNGVCRRKL